MKTQSVLKNHRLLWWEYWPGSATSSPFELPVLRVLLLNCTPTSNTEVAAGYLDRTEPWLGGILSVLTLKSKLLLTLGLQKWRFPHSHFPVRMHRIPLVRLAAPAVGQLCSWRMCCHRFCADRRDIDSFRQLLRVSVCSLFSTAWKDILILYAYRKYEKFSEHLLFINLSSYCSSKVINGKTEAQSN